MRCVSERDSAVSRSAHLALHHSHAAVCGAQVDADNLAALGAARKRRLVRERPSDKPPRRARARWCGRRRGGGASTAGQASPRSPEGTQRGADAALGDREPQATRGVAQHCGAWRCPSRGACPSQECCLRGLHTVRLARAGARARARRARERASISGPQCPCVNGSTRRGIEMSEASSFRLLTVAEGGPGVDGTAVYTRESLACTLRLMGVRPRHSLKVAARSFESLELLARRAQGGGATGARGPPPRFPRSICSAQFDATGASATLSRAQLEALVLWALAEYQARRDRRVCAAPARFADASPAAVREAGAGGGAAHGVQARRASAPLYRCRRARSHSVTASTSASAHSFSCSAAPAGRGSRRWPPYWLPAWASPPSSPPTRFAEWCVALWASSACEAR